MGGTPVPGSFLGLWSQVFSGGYPSPRFSKVSGPISFLGGTPVLAGGGVSQSCPSWGGTPVPGRGTPVLAREYPGQGYPLARIGLGYPLTRTGVLTRLGQDWGIPSTPRPWLGYPLPGWDKTKVPPPPGQDWGIPPPRQNSRASTCYAAGGMTQENFLVFFVNCSDSWQCRDRSFLDLSAKSVKLQSVKRYETERLLVESHYAVHDCPRLCLFFAASGHKIYVQSVAKLGSLQFVKLQIKLAHTLLLMLLKFWPQEVSSTEVACFWWSVRLDSHGST